MWFSAVVIYCCGVLIISFQRLWLHSNIYLSVLYLIIGVIPAPHIPVGRRPQWIQSFFILWTNRSAVSSTLRVLSPNWRLCANRWMYRQGSIDRQRQIYIQVGTSGMAPNHKSAIAAPDDICHCPKRCFQFLSESVVWHTVVVQGSWKDVPYCGPTENKTPPSRWRLTLGSWMHPVNVDSNHEWHVYFTCRSEFNYSRFMTCRLCNSRRHGYLPPTKMSNTGWQPVKADLQLQALYHCWICFHWDITIHRSVWH